MADGEPLMKFTSAALGLFHSVASYEIFPLRKIRDAADLTHEELVTLMRVSRFPPGFKQELEVQD